MAIFLCSGVKRPRGAVLDLLFCRFCRRASRFTPLWAPNREPVAERSNVFLVGASVVAAVVAAVVVATAVLPVVVAAVVVVATAVLSVVGFDPLLVFLPWRSVLVVVVSLSSKYVPW